jgi:hypothetical protein
MSTSHKLNTLLFELQTARSPLQQAKILVRAWRTLRELSPTDRRLLANHAGFDGAEEILEGLAKRRGGLAPAMLLRVLANARSTEGAAVGELLSAVRDPLQRDEVVTRGIDLAAELLADPEDVEEDDNEEVGETLGELPAVEPTIQEGPEEAMVTLIALDEDVDDGGAEEPEVEPVPVAKPGVEEDLSPDPTQPPEAEIDPSPPDPPIVDWSRWQTTSPAHGPASTSSGETPPAVDLPGPRLFDAQIGFETPGTEPSVLSRLVELRRELSSFAGSNVEILRERVESFEDGWARRRALAAILEAGIPESAGDALELIATLNHELDRRWCLGILARRGDLEGSRLDRALSLVSSQSARRRIEAAARA